MPFFRDIVGQQRSISILQSFLRKKETPQALLFEGEEGIGKRKAAEIFAQALFCQKNNGLSSDNVTPIEPCDRCLPCRKMKDRNHTGFSVLEPDGNLIKIDQIRDLQSKIVFKPIDGQKKIVIIDPAEKMNDAAANSLLKTLEEPPPYAVLILIAARTSALRPTLLSRCQKIHFQALSLSHVVSILCDKKGWTLSEARMVAALANGKLGKALSLEVELARDMDDVLHRLVFNDDLFQTALDFSKTAEQFELAFSYLFTWFRDLLTIKSALRTAHIDPSMLVYSWRLEEMKTSAGKMTSDDILDFLDELQAVHLAQIRNVNRQLSLETLLFKLQSIGGRKQNVNLSFKNT
ncbi:DNA polymerase III subunit delta' [Nitrospira defluvii]|nr:DNA polymerase III subunit delta' [Nitrospira defluvii]